MSADSAEPGMAGREDARVVGVGGTELPGDGALEPGVDGA